ncbi:MULTISPECIES: ABC transporter substrate-binding protein [unclassified Paludibacterium]|uniref:substrate-binding periplasmic protein n=1 Tax=unclassified Paludibacterium TaxID=2618429 RepID=UPI001C052B91|nr:transporter substrate-binding domain-containing protein [Paludibacterium sp. B53371]BEV70826.1 hypothetical protein THUN1379_03080 [Paludibacterium sp. THUN1379]
MLLSMASFSEKLVLHTSGITDNPIRFDPGNRQQPGFSIELMQALQKRDPDLSFAGQNDLRSIKRIESGLKSGKLDIFFGLVSTPSRQDDFHVITQPVLYVQHIRLAAAKDDHAEVHDLADLSKTVNAGAVAVPQGSIYVEQLKSLGGVEIDDGSESLLNCLKKLLLGRVRFVYYGGEELKRYLHDKHLNGSIKLLPAVLATGAICVVISRKVPQNTRARILAGLQKLQRDGTLDALRDKYGLSVL